MNLVYLLRMQSASPLQGLSSDGLPPPGITVQDLPLTYPLILEERSSNERLLSLQCWGQRLQFQWLYKPDWSFRAFQTQLKQLESSSSGLPPLLVSPYLDDQKIQYLIKHQLSGLDLSGNATLSVPGQLFIKVTGQPNRFRRQQEIQNPYQGKSSLVGRALLGKRRYDTSVELQDDIRARGGELSTALISRVLKALQEEVIVERVSAADREVLLLQPEKLLDELQQAWKSARKKTKTLWRGRVMQPTSTFLPVLFENACANGISTIMTGQGSASRYADITMENVTYLYADQVAPLLQGLQAEAGERFANLVILSSPDPSVTFDAQTDGQGIRWAAPLQTYLEMSTGDARMQQSAVPLREKILAGTTK